MSAATFFIAGTDTNVGKTYLTSQLLLWARAQGWRAAGMKPLASGGVWDAHTRTWQQEDLACLGAASISDFPAELANQYCFAPAIAPHLAAAEVDCTISIEVMAAGVRAAQQYADFLLVEGVGGWRCPIAPPIFMSALPQRLSLPVILVVGMRLGCLNHACLTLEAMQADGVPCLGWILNQVEADMPYYAENRASLITLLNIPLLGECLFAAPLQLTPIGEQLLTQYDEVKKP